LILSQLVLIFPYSIREVTGRNSMSQGKIKMNKQRPVGAAPQPLGSAEEVAEHLGVPLRTLAEWRHHGIGPRYLRVGRHVRYKWQDVEQWLDSRARGGDAA
jgi:excisionase family DNA binding protein